jgi:L-asparagine transporter-like permease
LVTGPAGYSSAVTEKEAKQGGAPDRDETDAERLDRNYGELLQELRVTQVGVQILFASLLTVAFTERFRQITDEQRATYVVTLLAAAAATAFLIGPVSFHRLVFRHSQKDDLVRNAHRMALGGLACLLVAVVGAVLLILQVVLGQPAATWFAAGVAAFFVLLWLVIPLVSRSREGDGGE